ncbi:MAG: glycoside hydrolase [Cephaloticoccus sp.]|nr:glycoside hydrolase [Cephaloticoccus sp.]
MKSAIVLPLPSGPGNPRNSEGSFITLKDGRILFAYSRYTGESWLDHARADIAARESTDGGRTWSGEDRILVKNEGRCNVMSVSFLRLHDGRIALFYVQKNSALDCRLRLRTSNDEGGSWSEPTLCNPASGYFVTNNDRVVQLASGRLIAPAAYHRPKSADGDIEAGINNHGEAVFFISDDAGATWREGTQRLRIASSIDTGLQEPGVIERLDGSLYGWARTSAGQQWEFSSTDQGETWTIPQPSRFKSPASPLSLKSIATDPLWLAVWNDIPRPIAEENGFAKNSSWGRTPLAVATSRDEGATWSEPILVEDDPQRGFCYIAIHPTDDAILLAYCCGGRGTAVLQDLCIRRLMRSELPL